MKRRKGESAEDFWMRKEPKKSAYEKALQTFIDTGKVPKGWALTMQGLKKKRKKRA